MSAFCTLRSRQRSAPEIRCSGTRALVPELWHLCNPFPTPIPSRAALKSANTQFCRIRPPVGNQTPQIIWLRWCSQHDCLKNVHWLKHYSQISRASGWTAIATSLRPGYRPSVGLQADSQGVVMWLYQSNQTPCMAIPVQPDAMQGRDLQICWLSIWLSPLPYQECIAMSCVVDMVRVGHRVEHD